MRISREEAIFKMAQVMSMRSTCSRLQVGAVLARDARVISTGYNGPPSNMPHCNHPPEEVNGCKASVHAEANALIFAGRYGVSATGASMYVTHMPCLGCSQLMVTAGIKGVVFRHEYRDESGIELLREAGISVRRAI